MTDERARYLRMEARVEKIAQEQGTRFSRSHAEHRAIREDYEVGALKIVDEHSMDYVTAPELRRYFADFAWEFPHEPEETS